MAINDEESKALLAKIEGAEPIGACRNNWRERYVSIFTDPDSEEHVISVGKPFKTVDDPATWVVCREPKVLYADNIGDFNRVFN